jgi:hypothetical protein
LRICRTGHKKNTAKNTAVTANTIRANDLDIAPECGDPGAGETRPK